LWRPVEVDLLTCTEVGEFGLPHQRTVFGLAPWTFGDSADKGFDVEGTCSPLEPSLYTAAACRRGMTTLLSVR
jgi:hypothetical protein